MSNPGESASLTDAVRLVLRRIIRLLVGSVSYPALADLIKVIYVEEAEKKLERSGTKAGNKGSEAAQVALEMVSLASSLRTGK